MNLLKDDSIAISYMLVFAYQPVYIVCIRRKILNSDRFSKLL